MNRFAVANQRGATLVVGLIMLLLLTIAVSSAFTLSGVNLKAVGNMQYRAEATAAANVAIEGVISSDDIFFAPAAKDITVGSYEVKILAPVCLRAVDVKVDTSDDPNPNILIEGQEGVVGGSTGFQDTYWNIPAEVKDSVTGAEVRVNQGVKIRLPANPNPCA